MSGRIEAPAGETGVTRVFSVDDGRGDMAADAFAAERLGAAGLVPGRVDVIDVDGLGGMTLSGYLAEAQGISRERQGKDAAHLDALTGTVLIAVPGAFGDAATDIGLPHGTRLVATFREPVEVKSTTPLESDGARGTLPGGEAPPTPMARGNTRVWIVAALVVVAIAVLVLLLS